MLESAPRRAAWRCVHVVGADYSSELVRQHAGNRGGAAERVSSADIERLQLKNYSAPKRRAELPEQYPA